MHFKKLYKVFALVITLAMIVPQSWVGATTDSPEITAELTPTEDEQGGSAAVEEEAGDVETPVDPGTEIETPTDPKEDPTPTPPGDPQDDQTPTPTPEAPKEDPTPTPTPTETPAPAETPTEDTETTPQPDTQPDDTANSTSGYGTNDALMAAQNIISPAVVLDSFRFSTIEKVYAIVSAAELNIYEDKDEAARVVGQIKQDGLCFIIKEEEDSEWIFIESGIVRGFVKKDALIMGEQAEQLVAEKHEENLLLAEYLVDPLDNGALTYTRTTVRETVVEKVYAVTTADNVNIREDMNTESRVIGVMPQNTICYILADDSEEWLYVESDDVRGFVSKDLVAYGDDLESQIATNGGWTEEQETILAQQQTDLDNGKKELSDREADRKEVKSNLETTEAALAESQDGEEDAPGSLAELEATADELTTQADDLDTAITELNNSITELEAAVEEGKLSRQEALTNAEASYQKVVQEIAPADNAACYYTLTSTKQASLASSIGSAMITYASQFLGNPYVWGGTSLTQGTDCSGFTQGIYAAFGYSIPRTSGEQSQYGTQVPVSEARTGDLIFYANNGTVYHVVMYIGDGQVIHASTSRTGIITSGIDSAHAVWATRIISDDDYEQIETVNANVSNGITAYTNATTADVGQYLGDFKLTAYCNCTICCGKWSGGPTASGSVPTEGRTVAMAGVPFGTKLIINGRIFTVEDRGTPYGHVDIYMNDHDICNQFGVQYAQVYLAN